MADKHIVKVEPEEEQGKEIKDGQDKSAKAIELLREVTMLLSDGSDGEPGKPEDKNRHIRVIGQPYRPYSQSQGQLGASRVLNNFRSVFAPYSRPPPAPLTSSIQPRRAKPLKSRQGGFFFQPKETWTHEFFCLALKNRERTPSRAEKIKLQGCGLGRKKICFHSKAKFTDFKEKLEEEFPKLKAGGGFVIMRTGHQGSNNLLATIPPPASGYSIPFLRDCSGLGQALAYIRPLQRDLDRNPLSMEVLQSGDALTITCLNCGKDVIITEWNQHEGICRNQSSTPSITKGESIIIDDAEPDNSTSECVTTKETQRFSSNTDSSHTASTTVSDSCIEATGKRECPDVKILNNSSCLDTLKDMFPDVAEQDLLGTLQDNDFELEETVNEVLDQSDQASIETTGMPCEGSTVNVTIKDAMNSYQKIVDTERCKLIDVDRHLLWKTALVFYKSTPKEHLYRKLSVMFEGLEDAVDAGALRLEFFGDLLRAIDKNLFEGKQDRRVPVYSWENVYLIKMAGIMVAHSLLQNGPGMPCLAPYVYEFLVSGEKEHAAAYVNFEDLPETPQTEVLIAFLKGVDSAQSEEDLNSLCDVPKYSTIIDRSGWPVGRLLNLKSKSDLITYLLVEELVGKRIQLLQHFRDGLDYFGLVRLIKESPDLWKAIFVTEEPALLHADTFVSLIKPPMHPDEEQAKAYTLFMEFIKDHVDCTENIPVLDGDVPVLNLLLKFITSYLHVPPTGIDRKISVDFLSEESSLPDAKSCFNTILLPVKYSSKEEFNNAMMTSLRHASCSFGSGF